MSDKDDYEAANMDAEYDGVQWIGGEAFYKSKKKKKKFTKEDHLYGVFAEDHTDQPPDIFKSRRTQSTTEFVSAGTYQAGVDNQEVKKVEISEPRRQKELEEDSLPQSFGEKIKDGALRRQGMERNQAEVKKAWKAAENTGFASFEKHSRGVASKLMQKMGYKPGEGLGARNQGLTTLLCFTEAYGVGMVKPIIQKIRPKSMGMGYGEFKEQAPEVEVEEKVEKKKPKVERLWKKETAERRKRRFKTHEEVINESEESYIAPVQQTIIDMRNPQTKILTDFSELNREALEDQKPLPELEHNMELLVELTEAEIRRLDSHLKAKEDSVVVLSRQESEFHKDHSQQTDQLGKIQALLQELRRMEGMETEEKLLEEALKLKELYPTEFVQYHVDFIFLQKIITHFEVFFRNWKPLEEDFEDGRERLVSWERVLDSQEKENEIEVTTKGSITNAYLQLILHVVLPPLRSAIVNEWNPKSPEKLLIFLEKWKSSLPETILRHVCGFLVFSKLKDSVEKWDPCQDSIPLHVWIHPWLPLMSQQLTLLYPIIIIKLINALQSWHASDSSALVLLTPWKNVFSPQDWENLLTKAILPKLARSLQTYEVNPLKHELEPITWAVQWTEIIPKDHIVNLLDSLLFPKWIKTLHYWLEHNPNFEEVLNWYISWKSVFPENIQSSPNIASRFGCALSLMNTAVEGKSLPPLNSLLGAKKAPQRLPTLPAKQKVVFTLRDLVQQFAEENNTSFLPKPGRMHEGLQVYSFGMVSVVLDNAQNIVKAQINGSWQSVSLEQLFLEVQNRQ